MAKWLRYFSSCYCLRRIAHVGGWLVIALAGLHVARKKNQQTQQFPYHLAMKILKCHDGDTCTAEDFNHQKWTLRLAGIDAPEIGQPPQHLALESQKQLEALVVTKTCDIEILGRDVYQRHLSLIRCDGNLANQILVQEGLAYAYINLKFTNSSFSWASQGETMARQSKKGIFSLPRLPQSPHQFRRLKKLRQHKTNKAKLYKKSLALNKHF